MVRAYGLCLLLGLFGCGDWGQSTDCAEICDHFRDCITGSYDIARCEERCEDGGSSNRREYAISECRACLDDGEEGNQCRNASYNCSYVCSWLVGGYF